MKVNEKNRWNHGRHERVCSHELVPRAALGLLCSFVLKTHSWLHFVVVRYRNVSQCSANTNKSLHKMLLLFSLLGYFLGRFQGVDGRCYLTSLGVSWHLRELESRGRVVLRPIFTLMFCFYMWTFWTDLMPCWPPRPTWQNLKCFGCWAEHRTL